MEEKKSKVLQVVNHKIFRFLIVLAAVAVFVIVAVRFQSVEKTEFVSTSGYSYERAVVTSVITDNLQENGTRVGSQYIQVKMTSGEKKGQILDATSSDGTLFGAVCHEGDHVIVTISVSGSTTSVSVYSQNRIAQVVGFVLIFLVLLCAIGGIRGLKSVIALAFTCLSFVYLFLPMMYAGVAPLLAAIIVAVIITIVAMYLIGGISAKSISAVVGTMLGVLISGFSAAAFGHFADIDGYNVSNIDTLVYVGQNTNIQIGGLLYAGILISSLGAVMDMAMSISSTICEIYDKAPEIPLKTLYSSGLNVGKDMMGTMSNTLILAFAGESLSLLMINYAYNLPFLQLINSYSIGIEIMQGVAGCIGVILTVPCCALVTVFLLAGKRKGVVHKEVEKELAA